MILGLKLPYYADTYWLWVWNNYGVSDQVNRQGEWQLSNHVASPLRMLLKTSVAWKCLIVIYAIYCQDNLWHATVYKSKVQDEAHSLNHFLNMKL